MPDVGAFGGGAAHQGRRKGLFADDEDGSSLQRPGFSTARVSGFPEHPHQFLQRLASLVPAVEPRHQVFGRHLTRVDAQELSALRTHRDTRARHGHDLHTRRKSADSHGHLRNS
ncbi:hypothetical protein [Streptomyces hypolithicus]